MNGYSGLISPKTKKGRRFLFFISCLLTIVAFALIDNTTFPSFRLSIGNATGSYSDLVLSPKNGKRQLLTMRDTLTVQTLDERRTLDMKDIRFLAVEPLPNVLKEKAKIDDAIYVEIRMVSDETLKGVTSRWLQEKGYIFKTQVDILAVDYIESNIYTSDKDIYIKIINRLPPETKE